MSYRRRIYFTAEQKNEIWDRWQRGVQATMSLLAPNLAPLLSLNISISNHLTEQKKTFQKDKSIIMPSIDNV